MRRRDDVVRYGAVTTSDVADVERAREVDEGVDGCDGGGGRVGTRRAWGVVGALVAVACVSAMRRARVDWTTRARETERLGVVEELELGRRHHSGDVDISFWGHHTPTVTFRLETECIPDSVKAFAPGFWAPGRTVRSANIVKHNFNSASFFETGHKAVAMTRSVDVPGLFEVTTTRVNFEYGFELVNDLGHRTREIGLAHKVVATHMGDCAPHFGKYRNRVLHSFNESWVYGTCEHSCPREVPVTETPVGPEPSTTPEPSSTP